MAACLNSPATLQTREPDAASPPPAEVASRPAPTVYEQACVWDSSDDSVVAVGVPAVGINGYDPEVVRRYLARNDGNLLNCYEKQISSNPALVVPSRKGATALRFSVTTDGVATELNVAGVDTEIAMCVARVVRAISFPRPTSSATVNVSLTYDWPACQQLHDQ